jgi:hypothetical protein
MPFAAPLLDDENDPNKNPNGGVNISGQSTTVSTGVPGQEAAAPGEKQKSSGQYTNIQSYLDANKPQGDAMGGKIADDVSAKADNATTQIQSYESKAPTVAAYDPNEAIGRATSLNDTEKAQYKTNKATGGYSGPQNADGIEGYQAANKAGIEAAGLVKNAGTESGQRDLLKQTYARPQYSAGENNLDQALVQGSAGSKSKMEALGQKYSGLGASLDAANTKVGGAVNAAIGQAATNKGRFNPAETAARDALINPIQARADQTWADNQALAGRVAEDATDEVLSEETLRVLGLTEGQGLFNMNVGDYATPDVSQVGINNIANADERGKYAALQSLFDDPTMNQITGDGKAINPINFNKEKFDKDYGAKKGEYDNAYANQRGTVLNREFLPESGGVNGYGSYIPSALTDKSMDDLNNASASELESYWLPLMAQAQGMAGDAGKARYATAINGINQSLAGWKNAYKSDRKVKKG